MSYSTYLLRLPSSYYFRFHVPVELQNIIGKKELRYSLRTILDSNMNWKQSRQLLDRVAGDIIQRFKDSVDEEGPEAIGMQLTNLELERTAEFFADLKFFGRD